ncbi:MAG: hypothetical protein ACPGDD_05865, partial [Poseidonia sp.]
AVRAVKQGAYDFLTKPFDSIDHVVNQVAKAVDHRKVIERNKFLEEALDTVYDPHGTGKPIKGAMILARSSDGNVRVRDVIRTYAVEGEDGISELAWTSPLTKYLIEAYDAC